MTSNKGSSSDMGQLSRICPDWLHELVLHHVCPATHKATTPWEIEAVKSMEAFALQVLDRAVITPSEGHSRISATAGVALGTICAGDVRFNAPASEKQTLKGASLEELEQANALPSSERTQEPIGYVWYDMVKWLQESALAQRGGVVNLHRTNESASDMVPVYLAPASANVPHTRETAIAKVGCGPRKQPTIVLPVFGFKEGDEVEVVITPFVDRAEGRDA